MLERSSRRSGSGVEAHPEVREFLVGPPGCLGVVERSSRRSGSGREALPKVREWSGDPSEGPGVVGM